MSEPASTRYTQSMEPRAPPTPSPPLAFARNLRTAPLMSPIAIDMLAGGTTSSSGNVTDSDVEDCSANYCDRLDCRLRPTSLNSLNEHNQHNHDNDNNSNINNSHNNRNDYNHNHEQQQSRVASLASRLRGRLAEHLPNFLTRSRRNEYAYVDSDLYPDSLVSSSSCSPLRTAVSLSTTSSSARDSSSICEVASSIATTTATAVASCRAAPHQDANAVNNNNNKTINHTQRVYLPAHLCERRNHASRPSIAGVGGTITTVTKSKRKTAPLPRLVAKNGNVNLFVNNIDRRQYVRDLFTTMIDIKWRYNLLAASFGFIFSWIFFACVWYLVLYVHRDLEPPHENWSPCIMNVKSFSEAVLFSIETQSTLGFGTRMISVECPGAILIFCIQLIFGVVVECLIVGMVFAKLSRPAKRSQTIMFSKCATVCLRGGKLCLAFRVGDVRSKSHIIGATIRASLVSQKITDEGEVIPFYHNQLAVKTDDSHNSLLLIWPVIIVHVIDKSSPFFDMNCEQFANFNFEIITVLEGTVESTGQSIQVRSSYLPSEVKWGYRFESIVSTHGFGKYAQTIIDYNKFNKISAVDTPTCSAREHHKRQTISTATTTAPTM